MSRKVNTPFRLISVEESLKLPKKPFYKALLRCAQKYPSIKRNDIIMEIKQRV